MKSLFLSLEKVICAIAASFIPLAAYGVAHGQQVKDHPAMWALVVASLAFSAPSVAQWAATWTGATVMGWAKAVGFTVLLECVLIFVDAPIYARSALAILTGINCLVALAAIRNRSAAFAVTRKRKPAKRKGGAQAVTA